MSIVGISGKKQSGKDLSGLMVQYLMYYYDREYTHPITLEDFEEWLCNGHSFRSKWKNVKFANKLKDIVCILLSCTREQLEDEIFKETPLGEEWDCYTYSYYDGDYLVKEGISIEKPNDEDWEFEEGKFAFCDYNKRSMTPRLLLQLLGTDCGRNIIHPNIWVNATMKDYTPTLYKNIDMLSENFLKPVEKFPDWIITDVRFPDEVKAVQRKDGIVIRINRYPKYFYRCAKGSLTNPEFTEVLFDPNNIAHMDFYKGQCALEHESETALDDYEEFDEVIINNETKEDLIFKIRDVLIKYNIINKW